MDHDVPTDPSLLTEDKVLTSNVLESVFRRGLDSDICADLIRACVGHNHMIWRIFDQPSGIAARWNVASLFVMAFLSHSPGVQDAEIDVPVGLGLDVIQCPRDLIDFHDICLSITSHWRCNSFDPSFFTAIRILEKEVSVVIKEQCPAPDHANTTWVIDICSILSYLWAQEHLIRTVLPTRVEEAPVFENEDLLKAWVKEQHERAIMAKIPMTRQLLGACVYPSELERYASENGGIFASDLATAIEDARPYIAHKALIETCENLDLSYGCGVLAMHLVNRFTMSKLKMPWAVHNVFIDHEFMGADKYQSVRHRTHPWIILIGNQWHIIQQQRGWRTTCPYRAILLWFHLLELENPEAENRFYMGWESWDLALLNDFPPTKH